MSQMTAFFRSLQGGCSSIVLGRSKNLSETFLFSVKAFAFIGINVTFQRDNTWGKSILDHTYSLSQ